jgi:hypothetical protein
VGVVPPRVGGTVGFLTGEGVGLLPLLVVGLAGECTGVRTGGFAGGFAGGFVLIRRVIRRLLVAIGSFLSAIISDLLFYGYNDK